jgi:succinate-semialdehyde dehydrogenase/glutarate-semialdehyde dehydrogenase
MSQRLLFIDGHWREGSDHAHRPLINPATESAIGTVACATPADIEAAIRAAQHALQGCSGKVAWRQTPVEKRADILGRAAGLLEVDAGLESPTFTLEQGKTVREARHEFQRAVETMRWHATSGADVLPCSPQESWQRPCSPDARWS